MWTSFLSRQLFSALSVTAGMISARARKIRHISQTHHPFGYNQKHYRSVCDPPENSQKKSFSLLWLSHRDHNYSANHSTSLFWFLPNRGLAKCFFASNTAAAVHSSGWPCVWARKFQNFPFPRRKTTFLRMHAVLGVRTHSFVCG